METQRTGVSDFFWVVNPIYLMGGIGVYFPGVKSSGLRGATAAAAAAAPLFAFPCCKLEITKKKKKKPARILRRKIIKRKRFGQMETKSAGD